MSIVPFVPSDLIMGFWQGRVESHGSLVGILARFTLDESRWLMLKSLQDARIFQSGANLIIDLIRSSSRSVG